MQIEKIFGEIPIFHDIKIDKILFESSYPILFTCIENRNILECKYLRPVHFVNVKQLK